jgi:hypothetical protein
MILSWGVRLIGIPAVVLLYLCKTSFAETGVTYSYVANTAPPDAFLSLKRSPSSNSPRIMAMANGTKLEVLRRRDDGWWYVKVWPTGEQGWAFSGQGNKAWILCCVVANEKKSDNGSVVDKQEMIYPDTAPPPNVYTPVPGSQERAAIMDAIRLATKWEIKFKVYHLMIARSGSKAIAVVDVGDALRQVDNGGVFELEGLNGQWRALYTVGGGGGADDCKTERAILTKMIDKAQEYFAPREIFPESFWKLKADNGGPESEDDSCTVSKSFVETDK